jgi:hypothetical protein
MKLIIKLFTLIIFISAAITAKSQGEIKGYFYKDGTYLKGDTFALEYEFKNTYQYERSGASGGNSMDNYPSLDYWFDTCTSQLNPAYDSYISESQSVVLQDADYGNLKMGEMDTYIVKNMSRLFRIKHKIFLLFQPSGTMIGYVYAKPFGAYTVYDSKGIALRSSPSGFHYLGKFSKEVWKLSIK